MTCRDCIHYEICTFNLTGNEWSKCFHFKNKADVVEVVRCKDCIHWWSPMEDDFHYCRLKKGLGGLVVKEDYCSFATRTPKERD